MSDWFIQHDEDTEVGPLQPSELLDLVRSGVVTRETLCRKGDSAWFRAKDVGGLFTAAEGRVIGYRCPFCSKSVSEPPTYCKGCSKYIDQAREVFRDANGRKVGEPQFDVPKENFKSWATWVSRLKAQRLEREHPKPRSDNN